MRVLNVVTSLNHGGGIENFLLSFFRAVKDRPDLELEVCFVGPEAGSMADEARSLGVRIWSSRWSANIFKTMAEFRRNLKQRPAFDVVHCHIGNHSASYLRVARQLGVKRRIAYYHNVTPGHKNDLPRRVYERIVKQFTLREATKIAGCSWAALKAYFPRRWDNDVRMTVVRCGMQPGEFGVLDTRADVRAEFGIPLDAPVIGHVGRFTWQKNHEGLLKAARETIARNKDVRFLLVGDGETREKLAAYARDLGIEENVIFAGQRKDVSRLLGAMDVFTLPSLAEGLPITLLEAQASGLPCVGSTIDATLEAIAPEFQSYRRDPHDAQGLATSYLSLLRESRDKPGLRSAAQAFAGKFTIESSCQGMLSAWGMDGVLPPAEPAPWAAPKPSERVKRRALSKIDALYSHRFRQKTSSSTTTSDPMAARM